MLEVDKSQLKGIVVAIKANFLEVEIDLNDFPKNFLPIHCDFPRILCTRRSRLDYLGDFPNVGDIVFIKVIDWNNLRGIICKIQPRTSFLSRPSVANVTDLILLFSVAEPMFDFHQTSRFLIKAEQNQLKITVVLNKIDLITIAKLKEYCERVESWGYFPYAISLKYQKGFPSLVEKLHTCKLSVLCGPSGVGKTSLINYLLPKKSLLVQNVSKKLKRGRHTTRHVELFSLENNSRIADSPGFNRPDLSVSPINFADLFPEIRERVPFKNCKFRNCLHLDEPGCAVDKDWDRYLFYKEELKKIISSHP